MAFFDKLLPEWMKSSDIDEELEASLIKELYSFDKVHGTHLNIPNTSDDELDQGLRHLIGEDLVRYNSENTYSLTVTGVRYGEENFPELKTERMMRELQRSNTRVEEDAVLELYPDHSYTRSELWDQIEDTTLAQEATYNRHIKRIKRESIVTKHKNSAEYCLTDIGRTAVEELFYFEED